MRIASLAFKSSKVNDLEHVALRRNTWQKMEILPASHVMSSITRASKYVGYLLLPPGENCSRLFGAYSE